MPNAEKAIKSLKARGFDARYFETAEAAKQAAIQEVLKTENAAVGFGGSETLRELGLAEALVAAGCTVHAAILTPPSENPNVYHDAQYAGVFLSSSNAITEDGYLVNIDGRGNRAASLVFGPKKLIILAGVNKLVEDIPAAIKRIKGHAAGLNCRRLGKKTPCAVDLICRDCKGPDRICRSIVITETVPLGMEQVVILLVGQELGY